MKRFKPVLGFSASSGFFLVVAVVVASAWQPEVKRAASVVVAPEAAKQDRFTSKLRAVRLMNAGDHAAARAEVERMISCPQSLLDEVDGHRMMAMSLRRTGDLQVADLFLEQSLEALAAAKEQDVVKSAMKLTILMDRADLAAFSMNEPERAVSLYDEVVSSNPTAPESLIAARNAAFLLAKIDNFSAAIERVDALLASPHAAGMSLDDRTALLASQASWFVAVGDLGQAFSHDLAIWNARTADGLAVANAGAMCVSWLPVQTRCDELLSLADGVLAMVDRLKASESARGADLAEILSCERQVATAIVSAEGCASPAAVKAARLRLAPSAVGPQ